MATVERTTMARGALRPSDIRLLHWLVALLGCAALSTLCVLFVDRPAARFAHDVIGRHEAFRDVTLLPEFLLPAAAILTVVLGLAALRRGSLPSVTRTLLCASVSFILAQAIKDQLKYACGRLWPETWINHNPSFIDTGDYGFFPFHGGQGWASFPSGHMTAITSVIAVLWLAWPRLRILWAACVAAMAVSLYGMDYHFVGDMIAGCFVGSAVGAGVAHLGGVAPRTEDVI